MHRSQGASGSSSPGKIFTGVRFVLFGFDSVSEAQYLSELVRRGGIDVGRYDHSCTHVIVSGRVYDDPVCVAALNDGKVLVTELWIDDSLDLGILVDATRILYRPVKDLNGIPGSKSLHICLTGYQRQDRDDIMKMVSLMGARFSKPLIANQVTHLICYKFEGEKYELAKKVNIKLVNHQWLEDCLKAWEILPIDNYTKSGWELEILEAQAKDSDEETEDVGMKSLGCSSIGNSTVGGGIFTRGSDLSIQSMGELRCSKDTVVTIHSASAGNHIMDSTLFTTPCKSNSSRKSMSECNLGSKVHHQNARDVAQASRDHTIRDAIIDGQLFNRFDSDLKEAYSSAETVSTSSVVDVKSNNLTYSRKPPKKSVSPEELPVNVHASPKRLSKDNVFKVDFDISPSEQKESGSDELAKLHGLTTHVGISNMEVTGSALPQKRKVSVPWGGSKSPKSECQSLVRSALQHPLPNTKSAQVEAIIFSPQQKKDLVLMDADHPSEDAVFSNSVINQQATGSKFKSISCRKKSQSHGKLVMGENSNAVSSPLIVNKHDTPSLKQASDEQECRTVNLSNTAPVVTDMIVSSSDGKALLDFPLDDKLMQVDDECEIMSNTANQFGSLAIGKLTNETLCNEKRPEISMGNPGEPELATKFVNGEAAKTDMQNLMTKEHTQTQHSKQDNASLAPDGRAMVTGNALSTLSTGTGNGNNVKVRSGARTKKAVAKRSLNSRLKLNAFSGRKDKHVIVSDKGLTMAEVISGKGEKMKVAEDNKVSRNLKDGAMEPFSVNEIMKERTEVAERPMPTNTKKDMTMDCAETTLMDPEKENMPEEAGRFNSNCTNDNNSKSVNKHDQKLIESLKNSDKMETRRDKNVINLEPAWFILSGHRLQRKEFQAVIRRLRGRICRDSHHWSYQATHFIAPDPVRRTEKFFAAAAAGRWILKTDFLTASNEAGKFLDEEPFEWYRKGLTEDGAISLEAPRKWRLLRERTGHGAFYRMRIVIYGECIAPTLDTLKRVVKAGDGTILATSPPYTRFLKSGVDYAIVSPSMPRVDSWVQEFLRHEIPCVAADYLVEYVCKPGYSLERHVLYKTHCWAEKSFANLLGRSEEINEDARLASAESTDDLSCAVCGSRDRGEVMLICGDEAGTAGCGIGTHIDCCDPPLESVPEGDWFCCKCSSMSNKTILTNAKAKRSSKAL